jgi:hypothetical protein
MIPSQITCIDSGAASDNRQTYDQRKQDGRNQSRQQANRKGAVKRIGNGRVRVRGKEENWRRN